MSISEQRANTTHKDEKDFKNGNKTISIVRTFSALNICINIHHSSSKTSSRCDGNGKRRKSEEMHKEESGEGENPCGEMS